MILSTSLKTSWFKISTKLEAASDTSAIQYLHQLGRLDLLADLYTKVSIPLAVATEITQGRRLAVDLPDFDGVPWIRIVVPFEASPILLASNLGAGEKEVLALGLQFPGTILILDDRLARRSARTLQLPHTGTIGILVEAKLRGLILNLAPVLDDLTRLRFRLSPETRAAALRIAGEESRA